ncbi:MAG: hypothetical protein OEU54_17735 [Gemmatimonadota bacterium]|nr:hypothetical protein [Gemmatimonadota bacterium]
MAELIVLIVVAVGIYKRGGRRFEWSRRSLGAAAGDLPHDTERFVRRSGKSFPAILGQCVEDMRALIDDMLGLIDPKARHRIETRARKMMARTERMVAPAQGSRFATAGHGGAGAYEALQKSYLEGSITLERYVEEAERLGAPR